MRRVRHSKSGLFLIELMICILFFSFTAGICIRFFVKSHQLSQNAKNLYQAQQEAASMAEILEKDIDSLNNIYVYYDKDWQQCNKEDMVYWMEVTEVGEVQESDLKKIKIALYTGKTSQKEEIYHLNLSIYVPQDAEAANDSVQPEQDDAKQKANVQTKQSATKQKESAQPEQSSTSQKEEGNQ